MIIVAHICHIDYNTISKYLSRINECMYDVLVVGGGIIGATILRELSKYQLSVCLLEKEQDVSMGQSRANSGIVHAGFDAMPKTLKAHFNVLGNKMMPSFAKELGVKYKNNGSIVIATDKSEDADILALYKRGKENGVKGLKILSKKRVLKIEPNLTEKVTSALYAKTGGIVCPYTLTISAIGNAMDNGAKLLTCFEVSSIKKQGDIFEVSSTDGRNVCGKVVINCAGINSQKIANLVGDNSFTIGARLGEYMLCDRESGGFVSHTIFKVPSKKGKGVLVSNTVDGNLLIGPTATVIEEYSTDTTASGLQEIIDKSSEMFDNIPFNNVITSFAGVRAFCDRNDFIIEESKACKNFINVAGIESPGLTASVAIAKHVVKNLVGTMLTLCKNKKFAKRTKRKAEFSSLSIKKKNAIIKKDPSFGKIVCRCEQITEGEIREAIRSNPPATTIDGVKRRTRAGMGRCQGGFCQIRVAEILAEELNKDFSEIVKSSVGANVVKGKTK